MSSKLPPKVAQLLQNFDGWLVGSAADPTRPEPRDFDILIPFHNWHRACLSVPADAKTNSFGGWKFNVGDVEIDIWPGDLSYMLQGGSTKYAYHLATDTRVGIIH